ncbi:MAG: hypothetical protein ABR971_14155 [Acidobacteriaceae bacterium]
MKRAIRVLLIVLTIPILFCVWFNIASDYDPPRLAGTYTFHNANVSTVLKLKADETFSQTLTINGQTKSAQGTWHRIGEGGVVFSGEFLRLPGERSAADSPGSEEASNPHPEFYGEFHKILTVYPEIWLEGVPAGVALHRKLFS